MSVISFDNTDSFSYQLHLPTFEGPLDLLLRLIEKQQLPISDISLVLVSDQFLEEAARSGGASPETVVEFTAVGARLVLLKARSLLPRKETDVDENEPSDLVVQLLEYKAVKEAAEAFAKLDQAGPTAFARGDQAVELPGKPVEIPLARHDPNALIRAIGRRVLANRNVARLVSVRPQVALRDMVDRLLEALPAGSKTFAQLSRQTCDSIDERRALFLALLVMVKRDVVDAEQDAPFADITVTRTAGAGDLAVLDIEEF